MPTGLTEPVTLAGRTAGSHVVFGPHETNLCAGRALSSRSVAYYERRARGGAGIVVTETASVHRDDWPYERAPLAAECASGWRHLVEACRPHGTLVLAGLGHTGLQGSSAYCQAALWAPSRVPDPVTRELPMEMEQAQIDAVLAGFREAARAAVRADVDGVEIDAGPRALLRQFRSGLTNHRTDRYGSDRLALLREVLSAVRAEIGDDRVLSLRLSCDELAPWAGITAESACADAEALADLLDLLVVVRGGLFSTAEYRPDAHAPAEFNLDLAQAVRSAVAGRVPVVAQGSIVDPDGAQQALSEGRCDLVEMTRAQIADPDLVAKARSGARPRPCLLCNQECQVRDPRNPEIGCVVNPCAGREDDESPVPAPAGASAPAGARAFVVGGGVAGLEAARVIAEAGGSVTVRERDAAFGGVLDRVAVGAGRERLRTIVDWLVGECERLGVTLESGSPVTDDEITAALAAGHTVLLATGGQMRPSSIPVGAETMVVDPLAVLTGAALPEGPVVVFDPVGGPVAVAVAETLRAQGFPVAIVTEDQVVGRELARTGDLAAANARIARAGIDRHTARTLRRVADGVAYLADRYTGDVEEIPCAALVDCSARLPGELPLGYPELPAAGDCVAPRTAAEAIREGHDAARRLVEAAGVLTHPMAGAP